MACWAGGSQRTPPLGPSVELPMWPRRAALGGGTARECNHWGRRWSSPSGHEALYWIGGDACGQCHWGFRWSSLWGHYWVE
eukprot:8597033-Pyramimonas_sp.AAC.1